MAELNLMPSDVSGEAYVIPVITSYSIHYTKLYDDDMNKEVVQPIELAGMTMDDMGEYLVLNRIMNDRSDVANPYGFTPDSAREQLEYFKKSVGEENFKMLEEKMKTFHEKVFASVEEAVRVGSYNKQIFEETIKPNKDTYAAFRVVDYIEENT